MSGQYLVNGFSIATGVTVTARQGISISTPLGSSISTGACRVLRPDFLAAMRR